MSWKICNRFLELLEKRAEGAERQAEAWRRLGSSGEYERFHGIADGLRRAIHYAKEFKTQSRSMNRL